MSEVVDRALGTEVPMLEPETVRSLRLLASQGWGAKRIAKELEIARNTVRRYLRGGEAAEQQVRPRARCLDDEDRAEAVRLFDGEAEKNAVVVHELLGKRKVKASVRTVQRAVQERRREVHAAAVASVRFETEPGKQMQIDFGQKLVEIAGRKVRVFLLVAVLAFSRRIFVKPFLSERGDDWREGIAAAFRHFGGVPRTVLGDNAKALVLERDREAKTVKFHPAYAAFCRDWDVEPRACAPYRARTKGKTESGVKYAKRNGLAGRKFSSFEALEAHLVRWMRKADKREHGTTHERPIDRFEQERSALRPLPVRALPTREQRVARKVSNDGFVEFDTVRYSVPHQLARRPVEVQVGEATVRIFRGSKLVATHARNREPYSQVLDMSHREGLYRTKREVEKPPENLAAHGRTLDQYAQAIAGGSHE